MVGGSVSSSLQLQSSSSSRDKLGGVQGSRRGGGRGKWQRQSTRDGPKISEKRTEEATTEVHSASCRSTPQTDEESKGGATLQFSPRRDRCFGVDNYSGTQSKIAHGVLRSLIEIEEKKQTNLYLKGFLLCFKGTACSILSGTNSYF